MSKFNAMGHLTLYPAHASLLTEGQIPRGIYVACSGRSKLLLRARDGKTIILKIAGYPPDLRVERRHRGRAVSDHRHHH
jgi:CRP-like cAMP-binding protein